jgi:hypothetical protein
MRSAYLEQNSGVSDTRVKIKKVVEDITLTDADSGSIILCNPTATTTITLPDVSLSGFTCKVVCTEDAAATDGSMNQIVNVDMGSGSNLSNIGQIHEVDGAAGDFLVSGDDFVVFTAAASPGDMCDFVSDGARWMVWGFVKDLSDSSCSANDDTIA